MARHAATAKTAWPGLAWPPSRRCSRAAVAEQRIDLGLGVEQQRDHLGPPRLGRHPQRRDAVGRAVADARACASMHVRVRSHGGQLGVFWARHLCIFGHTPKCKHGRIVAAKKHGIFGRGLLLRQGHRLSVGAGGDQLRRGQGAPFGTVRGAPARSSCVTTVACPLSAARCSGETPSFIVALTSALAPRSTSAVSELPPAHVTGGGGGHAHPTGKGRSTSRRQRREGVGRKRRESGQFGRGGGCGDSIC